MQTIKRGVFVTPDKRIELATIECQAETHHKFDRTIAYKGEHIAIFKCVFGLFFGIGARIRHPKSTTELERNKKKRAQTTTMTTAITDDAASSTVNDEECPSPRTMSKTTQQHMFSSKVSIAPVTHKIHINTLAGLST
jgi:hypothetical protein